MNKAIFLDRDGTLIPEFIRHPECMDILPDVLPALTRFRDAGYKVIVVSNQADFTRHPQITDLIKRVNERFRWEFRREGFEFDGIYYCHHAPEMECSCRKPAPGLLLKAAKHHDVALSQSWMIGDRDTDVLAGHAAGVKGTIRLSGRRDMTYAADTILGARGAST